MKMIGAIIIGIITAIIGFPVWDFRNGTGFSLPNTLLLFGCIFLFNLIVDFFKSETK